ATPNPARYVTSSPTSDTGTAGVSPGSVRTRYAASGSNQMLNSAAGVVLPAPIDPPITTTRARRAALSRYRENSSATLVSGPLATSVTGSAVPSTASARRSTA